MQAKLALEAKRVATKTGGGHLEVGKSGFGEGDGERRIRGL